MQRKQIIFKNWFIAFFRIATLVLGSIMIGTNMFSLKTTLGTILYCFLIFVVIIQMAIEIAVYLLQENYIYKQKSIIERYRSINTLYVELTDKYKNTITTQNREIKKLKRG